MKISVAIATRNEEKNIKDCLASVAWADEIVIFDEESTDKTVAIARKYTKNVFLVDHDPMFHRTKQKAIDKCSGDWILQIDADERVTPELREEILGLVKNRSFPKNDSSLSGYRVPRKSRIFGKWMQYAGWYPDYQLKFFHRGKGHYPCETVHEDIVVDGEIGTLKSDLVHYHYDSVTQFVERLNRYTTDDVGYLLSKGESITWSDAIKFPADEFLKRFFFWEGYKDGMHGLVLSLLQAFSRFVVFAKMWEEQKFWEHGDERFLEEVVAQSKKVSRDWNHWLAVSETNLAKKVAKKVLNKARSLL